MPTFQTLWQNVLDHHFDATNFTQEAKDQINDAQMRVAERIDLRAFAAVQTTALAAGASSYNLPADFLRARFLENATDGWPMEQLNDYRSLEQANLAGTDTTSGAPSFYVIEAGTVKVYPAASLAKSIKLYYYRTPATLSANGDLPEIPVSYHRSVLVPYAVAWCFRREGDAQMAQFFQAEFERELDRMAIQLQWDGYEGPRQVAGAW
jgi:hypothetical protein